MSKPHFIYFVSAARRTVVKIGMTQDVANRMVGLQGGNHTALKLELVLQMPDKREAYLLEDALHQHFAAHWRRSEWFDFDPSLRAYVSSWKAGTVVKVPYPDLTCKQIIISDQGTVMQKGDYLQRLRAAARSRLDQ